MQMLLIYIEGIFVKHLAPAKKQNLTIPYNHWKTFELTPLDDIA